MSQQADELRPRRAADAPTSADSSVIIVTPDASPTRARRSRHRRVGRGALASVLAGAVATATLFGLALGARNSHNGTPSAMSTDMAVPAAAVDSARQGFADRTEIVSRNAVRSNLAGSVASEAVAAREQSISANAHKANEVIAHDSVTHRDEANEKDLQLVAQQEAKLKEEAKQAQRRIEMARKAKELGGAALSSFTAEELAALNDGQGSMPVKSNFRIGAPFGAVGSWSRYHTGQDFPAPTGTPIYAVASGIVLSPTAGGWAGINVVLQHGNGGATLYAHMSSRVVQPGDVVKAGQLIGYVGTTGRSFGSHLHMEYYKPGATPGDVYQASDPMAFIHSLGKK